MRGAPPAGRRPPAVPPRYTCIQPLVRNGPSVLHEAAVSRDQAVKAQGEVFARVSPAALRALLLEGRGDGTDDVGGAAGHAAAGQGAPVSVVVDAAAGASSAGTRRVLLLDVRPAHAHAAARVVGAVACDPVRVRQDRLPAALAVVRTSAEVAVVAYADDEGRELTELATKLCNVGFANVAVVTGGLAAVAAAAPELLDGPLAGEYAARVDAALADRTRPPLHALRRQQLPPPPPPQPQPPQPLLHCCPPAAVAGGGLPVATTTGLLLQSSSRLVAVGGAWRAGGGGGGGSCESSAASMSAIAATAALTSAHRRSSSSSSVCGAASAAPASTTTIRRAASANNVFRGTGTEAPARGAATAVAAAAGTCVAEEGAARPCHRRSSRSGSVTAPASRGGYPDLAASPGPRFAGAARFR